LKRQSRIEESRRKPQSMIKIRYWVAPSAEF
jgi:hypothetical protein